MTDQEQMIKTLQDELVLQARQRRMDIAQAIIGRGYPPGDVPYIGQLIADWVEGTVATPEIAPAILKAAGKKRGRPAKKSAVVKKKGKRKYTKRSKFWSGKGKD